LLVGSEGSELSLRRAVKNLYYYSIITLVGGGRWMRVVEISGIFEYLMTINIPWYSIGNYILG
jgi:hypothetical protein